MENHKKILIVDDDPDIREILKILLGSEGYLMLEAENGEQAINIISNDKTVELMILDIMMPGLSGVEVCQKIRNFSKIPVLFLTAKSQDKDKIEAYSDGGDDYLVKPFSQTELLLKVNALIRRYKVYNGNQKGMQLTLNESGGLILDTKTKTIKNREKNISLTDKEYEILHFFLIHRGEVVSNKNMYEGVWQEKYLPSASNTIMVHILNLRKKLEDDINNPIIIKTVWGKGYKID